MNDPLSFREYLKKSLELHYKDKGKINISSFSRRAGFSSRSFLSDLLSGKKRLSRESLVKITSTLNVPRSHANLLEVLAYLENEDIRPKELSLEQLEKNLTRLLRDVRSQSSSKMSELSQNSLFLKPELHIVYASLGSVDKGSTLQDIQKRSKLDTEAIQLILDLLLEKKTISQVNNRYFVEKAISDVLGFKDQAMLTQFTINYLSYVKNVTYSKKMNQDLFYYAAFTVNKSSITKIKKRIQQAVLSILDEYQDDDADQVEQIYINMMGT
jgi:hypothetical protein